MNKLKVNTSIEKLNNKIYNSIKDYLGIDDDYNNDDSSDDDNYINI